MMNLFIHLPIAKNIQEATSQTYYEGVDRSIIYDLSRKAMQIKQVGRSIAFYFFDLKAIWQELDHLKPITFTQVDAINVRQKEIDEERVYLFMTSVHDNCDLICGEILRTIS